MRNIILVALAIVGSAAHALMIDDFSTGNINDTISAGNSVLVTAATVPGGFRYTNNIIDANPLNRSHSVIVTNGVFVSDSQTLVDAQAWIAYGADANSNFTNLLDLDLSGNDRFRFTFASNDLPATIQMQVYEQGFGSVYSTVYNIAPNMIMMNQTVEILFSDFAGINFANVDGIGIFINTGASGDVVLDSFEAVPEPASMVALGLGVAALVARKKRKA